MKKIYLLLFMAISLISCGFLANKPKGDLTYCSYCCAGAAGLGTDYCELIAEPDSVPKVVVVLDEDNRFDNPVIRQSYPVDKSVVDSLQQLLKAEKVYKLNGYHVDEAICGGRAYSFSVRYSSGDRISVDWYGHNIKEKAWDAYHMIEHFFRPWRERAQRDGLIQQRTERIVAMGELFDHVSEAVRTQTAYPDLDKDVNTLRRYIMNKEWQEDFDACEKGIIPKETQNGVLSKDAIYMLLGDSDLRKLMRK